MFLFPPDAASYLTVARFINRVNSKDKTSILGETASGRIVLVTFIIYGRHVAGGRRDFTWTETTLITTEEPPDYRQKLNWNSIELTHKKNDRFVSLHEPRQL